MVETVTTTSSYQAYCWCDEAGWWIIEVPAVPGVVSQARRLDQVAAMAADAVALALDTDPGEITVEVCPQLDSQRRGLVENFAHDSQVAEDARGAAAEAAAQVRSDVAALVGTGLTAREVAHLLGISPQRVSQLADRRRAA
jgi:predicted RNase H-like HicB family nuclease